MHDIIKLAKALLLDFVPLVYTFSVIYAYLGEAVPVFIQFYRKNM